MCTNLPAIKEHATCSPVETNTSCSEAEKLLLISKDFFIACSENAEISIEHYHQLQVDFNIILRELFFVQKDFYTQFDERQIPEESEVKLVDYETAKYYGHLNNLLLIQNNESQDAPPANYLLC